MPRKKLIKELRKLIRERGSVTKEQREYAMVEEQGLLEMYPITKPSEEKRFSHLRNLQSYIGEHGITMLEQRKLHIA